MNSSGRREHANASEGKEGNNYCTNTSSIRPLVPPAHNFYSFFPTLSNVSEFVEAVVVVKTIKSSALTAAHFFLGLSATVDGITPLRVRILRQVIPM